MTPLLQLTLGVATALLAMVALVMLVIAPPMPRVAADRRRAPGVAHVSSMERVTAQATTAVDKVLRRPTRRLFGAEELELAGVRSQPSEFVILVLSATAVLALFGFLVGIIRGVPILFAIVFAILGPLGAKVLLNIRASRRRAKFADQLDDTLQLLASSLRAGHGLQRSIDAIATELDAPMSEELTRVVNETRLGRDTSDSLLNVAERMQSEDFLWTAQAIAVNRETGGNLSEILSQIAATIRERNQIQRQVRTLSAEGKMSGWILIALPIALFIFFVAFQPAYATVFFTTVIGWIAMAVGVLLLIVGTVWMLLAVRVKV